MNRDPAFAAVTRNPELITERARVLRVADGVAWVHCESQAGCARCAAGQGCGGGIFAKLLRGRLQELPVVLPASRERDPVAGEWLLIGLSTSAVQHASLLMYGLPLAGLMLGSIAGSLFLANDAVALLGAVLGLGTGLLLARRRAGRITDDGHLQPVLLRILAPGEPCPAEAEA